MRLLHNGKLVERDQPEKVDYAILSHTWEAEEVTYDDLPNGVLLLEGLGMEMHKKGYHKIDGFCQVASSRNFEYMWVDTCCIDKSRSAELAEAINSMFKWYQGARLCIVYLHDLEPSAPDRGLPMHDFRRCKWFSRGWTLQELIAPQDVEFYDREWNLRGTKAELAHQISQITRIDIEVLKDSSRMWEVSVARRMSWAAERATTKVEDLAYSLLGIFDVNLPMIYGEGEKAFIRLQEAIAMEQNDLSLFAWTSRQVNNEFRGIFAQDPSEFRHCNKLVNIDDPAIPTPPFSITNKGLKITACLGWGTNQPDYLLNLHCIDRTVEWEQEQKNAVVVIRLVKTTTGYVRRSMDRLVVMDQSLISFRDPFSVYIPKTITPAENTAACSRLANSMRLTIQNTDPQIQAKVSSWQPDHLWDANANLFLTGSHPFFTAVMEIDVQSYGDKLKNPVVIMGLEPSSESTGSEQSGVSAWATQLFIGQDADFEAFVNRALHDPYALSALGHRIRTSGKAQLSSKVANSLRFTGLTSRKKCSVKVDPKQYKLQHTKDGLPFHEFVLQLQLVASPEAGVKSP